MHGVKSCWGQHSFDKYSTLIRLELKKTSNISPLTHWGRVTLISVGKLTITGLDNGLSPERRQAIIWTNTGILLIGDLGTNYSEIFIEIDIFSFKKMHLKISSAKWCPSRLGLNVLKLCYRRIWDDTVSVTIGPHCIIFFLLWLTFQMH